MNIAFYAPLKPPDHPVPSGDRLMARLLIEAMKLAGHSVELVSRFRSLTTTPENPALVSAAQREVTCLLSKWQNAEKPERPDIWFCYHPYYRAPDLIGLGVARALQIPYATAEASYAGKRDRDGWQAMQRHVRDSLEYSAVNFTMTGIDREGIEPIVGSERIVELPPFIDTAPFKKQPERASRNPLRLISVAMMRTGAKLESYRFLAKALSEISSANWHLTIIGDGAARQDIAQAFGKLSPDRISWAGECDDANVRDKLSTGDIFLWPGIGEAYGLAYLEAQASGLPVVALKTHGVPYVVEDGKTGLLTPAGDVSAYADAVSSLLGDAGLRENLARNARAFVMNNRTLGAAAEILDAGLRAAILRRPEA